MRRFRYGADPLAFVALLAYAGNRWLLKPHLGPGFFHDHFNDLWLIPAALPWVLLVQRKLAWRAHDRPPDWGEIFLHLGVWTFICEGLGPHLVAHATADWRDALAYLAGALAAGTWWHRHANEPTSAPLAAPSADPSDTP